VPPLQVPSGVRDQGGPVALIGAPDPDPLLGPEGGRKEILEQALKLKPEERFMIVEGLLNSLDEPDRKLDDIWAEEAEKRLKAY
jgi:hypothetical protein